MQAILDISLKDIKSNWVALNNASNGKAAAVIKANSYGIGMIKVAKTLMKAGCNYFYVANLNEGIQLRKKLKLSPLPARGVSPDGRPFRQKPPCQGFGSILLKNKHPA